MLAALSPPSREEGSPAFAEIKNTPSPGASFADIGEGGALYDERVRIVPLRGWMPPCPEYTENDVPIISGAFPKAQGE